MKPGHAEGALEALFVDHALLHGMQRAVGAGQPFDGGDLLAARGVRQDGAGIMRDVVDQDGAGAAFRTVAPELGAGEPQLVAQRGGQRLLLHHVHAPLLAVDVEGNQPWERFRSPGDLPCRSL
jgi:hypothetical protein